MSTYHELIKNFEKIRAYMREFYVYGFKTRMEYDKKSPRSYDDERRRIESWLGDHMRFVRTPEGKNVFLSIDSRLTRHNPFYRAWKAKSFTAGDITLHFILFDILFDPSISLSMPELLAQIDRDYLSHFDDPLLFDESTLRKKLKEYIGEGLIVTEKKGRNLFYRRADNLPLPVDTEALHFFSEAAPCGVIGSFLLDKSPSLQTPFGFKHHYITHALDSDVTALLFDAMGKHCEITAASLARRGARAHTVQLVPLRIFISVQSGRQHLLAYDTGSQRIRSLRIDYLSDVKLGKPVPDFQALRRELDQMQQHMWGVAAADPKRPLERVSFTLRVMPGEEYIIQRLRREKRMGAITQTGPQLYRFEAEVWDSGELIPWIRTFICRIVQLDISNKTVENQFREDMAALYRLYGLSEKEALLP